MSAEHNQPDQSNDQGGEAPSFFDQQLFDRVRSIKQVEKETVDEMDTSIDRIQNEFESLKTALSSLPQEERRLMTVLVTRSIKRSLREILLEQVRSTD